MSESYPEIYVFVGAEKTRIQASTAGFGVKEQMGRVEMFIDEEGSLKVVQYYDLRVLLKRLRPKDSEHHRVVTCGNCNCLSQGVQKDDATVNYVLSVLFVILLSLTVVCVIIYDYLLTPTRPSYYSSSWGPIFDRLWLFGLMFVTLIVVCMLMKKKKKSAGSAPQKMEEVQTISALVQQV